METLREYLPIILPIILIQFILIAIALSHALRHPHYRFGNRIIWIVVIIFLQIIGPVLYLTVGREEE